jgi:hypothetical protein
MTAIQIHLLPQPTAADFHGRRCWLLGRLEKGRPSFLSPSDGRCEWLPAPESAYAFASREDARAVLVRFPRSTAGAFSVEYEASEVASIRR